MILGTRIDKSILVQHDTKQPLFTRKAVVLFVFCNYFCRFEFRLSPLTTEQATDRKKPGLRGRFALGGPFTQYGRFSRSTCRTFLFCLFFSGGDLCLHFPDQFCQLFLTLGFRLRVDVPAHAPAVDDGGVAALPQMAVDLADASGTRFAPLSLVGLEGAGGWFLGCRFLPGFRFGSPDSLVDLVRRVLPHGIGDVGVGVQGGGAGHHHGVPAPEQE